ncbi:MAG: MFS transporter [Bacilli bacterium]|jgi:GPH family glycoside/pentoside/hexuronide:cation symporter|nr:MFS transporter [Bacilli bacterium]
MLIEKPFFDSRAKDDKITKREKIFGYFISPAGMAALNGILGGYVNIFYTDTLKLSGLFLILLPIISKIISSIFTVFFGRIIDKTKSKQGKARPWLLLSAPLCAISAVFCFFIPQLNEAGQLAWIFITYNLYFSFAYTMYSMSHSLLVPLSTSDVKERNSLSVWAMIGQTLLMGTMTAIVFTIFLYPYIKKRDSLWLPVISGFAALALILTFVEYYWTLERNGGKSQNSSTLSFQAQLKALFTDKFFVLLLVITALSTFASQVKNLSLMYYCSWDIGTYETGEKYYALIQVVGNLPLGWGSFLIFPLMKKMSKQKMTIFGLFLAFIGDAICFFFPRNLGVVIAGQLVASVGLIPLTFIMTSFLADALDHVAYHGNGRSDGAGMSSYHIVINIFVGLAQGFLNLMLSLFNYHSPDTTLTTQAPQSEEMQKAFTFMFSGLGMIIYLALGVIFCFFNIEKHMPPKENKKEANPPA